MFSCLRLFAVAIRHHISHPQRCAKIFSKSFGACGTPAMVMKAHFFDDPKSIIRAIKRYFERSLSSFLMTAIKNNVSST